MKNPVAEKLLDFMKNSPTRYQVVANFEQRLNDAGYTKLYPEKVWQLENGGKYYLSPNGTAIMAFRIPNKVSGGFCCRPRIAHSYPQSGCTQHRYIVVAVTNGYTIFNG